MGFNTTVIVLNDALDAIANDPEFGKKLSDAILHLSVTHGESVDVSALSHVNAATAVETHHADLTTLVAVGGNYATLFGTALGYKHHNEEDKLNVLKQVANEMGYRLVRNMVKRKT